LPTPRRFPRRLFEYAVAFVAVAMATMLRRALTPLLDQATPFITYFPAIVFAVWATRDLGPSLFALGLSTLAAAYYFLEPTQSLLVVGRAEQVGLGLFVVVGLALVGIGQAMRRAEREATRRAETLRVTLSSIGDAVITTDTEGRVTSLNLVAESLTGWTDGAARGRPLEDVFDIVHEDTNEPVETPVRRVLAEGVVVGLANHAVLRSRDGRSNPIDDSAAPILGEGGTILGVVLVFRDVGGQRTNARRVEQSEALKSAILESALDSIVTIDADNRIVEWNAAAEATFGYPRGQAVGQDMAELIIPPELRSRHRAGIAHYLATGSGPILGRRMELTALRRDGSTFPVEITVTPIAGLPRPLFTGHLRDISERKRSDAERETAELHLARIAADLLEADRRKSEFLAMLAHELRNPLAPMRNAMEILRRTGGHGQESATAMEMMRRQVGQMVRLIDDLLDVSRISQGKIELRRASVPLAMIVEHAVEAARPPCDEMEQTLSLEMTDEPMYVDGDSARLVQVLGNLLSNACKFTARGGMIRLVVGREDDHAVLRVVDNGIGIAADHLDRIFELFAQVDASLERSHGGLGIGLTLVKSLVELHSGRIEVESAGVGHGSTFTVRLPLVAPPAAVTEPAATASATAAPAATRRILVVDDNADSADSLALLLRLSGHEVATAFDGGAAVSMAASFAPDVILLDLGLPVLNGYEAAERIRSAQGARRPLLIALTGWGQEDDRRRSREAGFDCHLVKPVDPLELIGLLADRLADRGPKD
jgi:PAS domain S-box-containing protein